MAGKLTIRRVGHLLPTLCLVVLLLVVGIITWLSTAGLPGCALRYIEREASAAAGLPITIEKIKLAPRSGLAAKAEDVGITIEQPGAQPATIRVRKAQVTLSISRLLAGELQPSGLHVLGLNAVVPLSDKEGDAIHLDSVKLNTEWPQRNRHIRAELNANLQGIVLQGKVTLSDPTALLSSTTENKDEKETQKPLGEYLAEIRPHLQQFKKQIDEQKWENVPPPSISISASHRNDWNAEIKAQIPSFREAHFHFQDVQLAANYEKNTFTVHNLSFRTEKPDTKVRLQASYDLNNHELSFTTRSTAPVISILDEYLGDDAPPMLHKLRSSKGNTPVIEVSGTAAFSDNFALNSITLHGKLEQQGFLIGDVPANYLLMTFYMRDGSFNLDQCRIELPDGSIDCAAQLAEGTGKAEMEVSLPDETLLALAREISGNTDLSLPEGLSFSGNLEAHLSCEMSTKPFEAGKSQLEDLIPTLQSCHIRFRTPSISLQGAEFHSPALQLKLDGINYKEALHVDKVNLQVQMASTKETNAAASDVTFNLDICNLDTDSDFSTLQLGPSALKLHVAEAKAEGAEIKALNAETSVDGLRVRFDDIYNTLASSALVANAQLGSCAYADTKAQGLSLNLNIPAGINRSEPWLNIQQNAHISATLQQISSNNNFSATDTELSIHHTATNTAQLRVSSNIGGETAILSTTASLSDKELVKLENLNLHLPAAGLLPLLGNEEPLAELKLPRMVDLQGDALIDPNEGKLLNCHYNLHLPELVRVCNNVFVHKGMEIPLQLDVKGSFSTAPDGSMFYDADVDAVHAEGKLDIHVSGDPLKNCHITGSNTIPVSIINALIDNADAHWIMRDFRCTPGLTRNVITDIDTIIRYDNGVYVNSRCKANLYNMDFLLGAIRDKEDAQGNPTGEEYLRTDLSKDPYSRVKEGHCDVEVVVQLDCKDADGQPLKDEILINLLNPDLLYDNRPWLKRMKIKDGVATSRIVGEAVRFDIEACTISLHKLKGSCYPAYSIGMYYAPLQHFLEDVVLELPAEIETEYCLFPISSSCEVPMKGLIRAEAATRAGFRFLGTTIPFKNFSGFINISDTDVYLDRMNAQSWGGVVNGALRIDFSGEHTTLDGYFSAHNLNLKDIVASYGTEFTPATCNGFIRFQAPSPDLEAVRAYGQVHLQDGDLMEIGLFRPIGALISDMPNQLKKLQNSVPGVNKISTPEWSGKFVDFVWDTSGEAIDSVGRSALKLPFANHFLRYGIDEASAKFDITQGHLITRDMKARGYNLDVDVKLDLNLNDLTFKGELWPRISSVPTVLISPVTILSKFLIDINLYGDILNPQWKFGLSKKLQKDAPSLSSEPQKEQPATQN